MTSLRRSRAVADAGRAAAIRAIASGCWRAWSSICEASAGVAGAGRGRRRSRRVFLALVAEAERDIRARLAERLARADWAPPRADRDAGQRRHRGRPADHRRQSAAEGRGADPPAGRGDARAPDRGGAAPAPSRRGGRGGARAGRAGGADRAGRQRHRRRHARCMARLVDRAKTSPRMGAPLAAHPRLTQRAGRSALPLGRPVAAPRRSSTASTSTSAALDALARRGRCADGQAAAEAQRPGRVARSSWCDKLAAAGQLRPGYLVRVLKEHQLGLFEAALAKLGGFHVEDVHRAVTEPGPAGAAGPGLRRRRHRPQRLSDHPGDGASVQRRPARRRRGGRAARRRAPLVRSRPISPPAPSARRSPLRRRFDKRPAPHGLCSRHGRPSPRLPRQRPARGAGRPRRA